MYGLPVFVGGFLLSIPYRRYRKIGLFRGECGVILVTFWGDFGDVLG